ncbi:MAG: M24 family metallopeptidase [Parvibaculaceae bacterium]
MSEPFAGRLRNVARALAESQIDAFIAGPSANQFYLSGTRLPQTERFNALIVRASGDALAVLPALQVPLSERLPKGLFEVRGWAETDNPMELVRDVLGAPKRIAIDAKLWGGFVLGLQKALPNARFVDGDPVLSKLREIKSAEEISLLEESAKLFDDFWDDFHEHERLIGRSENQVRQRIMDMIRERGFEAIEWCDVGAGPNGASPLHHGSDRIIEAGDPVVIDFGAVRKGYVMDTCRTPVAGKAKDEFVRIYDIVNAAHEAAALAARPGISAEDVDRAGRQVIAEAGFGDFFIHRIGHGLGIDAHEEPYLVSGSRLRLAPGMVFSNEPGIYIPGKWGVRIENIMVMEPAGARSLNHSTRDLQAMG